MRPGHLKIYKLSYYDWQLLPDVTVQPLQENLGAILLLPGYSFSQKEPGVRD